MILCGDIGATKSLLGLARRQGETFRLDFVRRYENRDWPNFNALVLDFIAVAAAAIGRPIELTMAGFGVAGPVGPDGVHMTNRDWQIGDDALRTLLGGAPVCLLNDFEANAHGVADLSPEGLLTLQEGETVADAPQLLIGAGSGLGVAFRLPAPGGARVIAGEGGHIGFAPRDARQAGFWMHLQEQFGRVSAEHVVSGPGLVRIHNWLVGREEAAAGSGEEVWARALAGDPCASEALAMFVDAYGAVSGDHALSVLARGGVFLTGGVAPRLLPAAAGSFLDAFRDKGPHSALAAGLPVHLVIDERLPLLGAARAAWQHASH